LLKQKTIREKKPEPGQLVRTGYAILVKDKLSSALRWHTFPESGNIEESTLLNPNEPIILRTNTFQIGTRVDIYERVELKKETNKHEKH